MLSTPDQVQEQTLLVHRESSCTSPLNRALRMHPNPNNDGGRKRTLAPYVHPSLQHLTTPTLFHQADSSNSALSFAPPALTQVNYYPNSPQEYARVAGPYSPHLSIQMDSSHSHNSAHQQHTGTLQSPHSADPISSSLWPEVGSTVQPQYQLGSINGRHEEDAALWHSFLNESTLRPSWSSRGPSEVATPVASMAGDPVQTSQRTAKRKRLIHRAASVEEDSPDSDDGAPNPAVKRYNTCANCQRQRVKCIKIGNDPKCQVCQMRGVDCVFEIRRDRKRPIPRRDLLDKIASKDRVITSLVQLLKSKNISGFDSEDPSSGSPASSLATDQPWRLQIEQWLTQAQQPTGGVVVDNRNEPYSAEAALENLSIIEGHPLGLLAHSSLRESGSPSVAGSQPPQALFDVDALGIASPDYFKPNPFASRLASLGLRKIQMDTAGLEEPKLLQKGLIVPSEVDLLFSIYWDKINIITCVLDPTLHTPANVFTRCPLLFTVVCAIASRFYRERPELYSIAMHFAKTSAASTLVEGRKSIELCQAYLLLAVWSSGSTRTFDEDRGWLWLGYAIRMAMDLNLHLPPTASPLTETQEREELNRIRTWIYCFNQDRCMAAQLGKPITIQEDPSLLSHMEFMKRSQCALPQDMYGNAYTALLRIVSGFREGFAHTRSENSSDSSVDIRALAFQTDTEILHCQHEVLAGFESLEDPGASQSAVSRRFTAFYINYNRLVVLSLCFHWCLGKGLLGPGDEIVIRCFEAATNTIHAILNDADIQRHLPYSPDKHFMFLAFAAAFLLNILRPKFAHLLSEQQANTIISSIGKLIQVLNEAAIDETHMARSYAKFLSSLLEKHRSVQEGGTVGAQGTSGSVQYDPSVQGFLSQYSEHDHPHVIGPEGQELYGAGPDIHITGPQDMLQSISRAGTNSSVSSTDRFIRHSDLWPPSFTSLPDYGMKQNGESVLCFPFEHGIPWQTADGPNTRPSNAHTQL